MQTMEREEAERKYNGYGGYLTLASLYSTLPDVTGQGCVCAGFGCHEGEITEPVGACGENSSNPALIDYMMRGGAFDEKGIWNPDNRGLVSGLLWNGLTCMESCYIIMPHREGGISWAVHDRRYREISCSIKIKTWKRTIMGKKSGSENRKRDSYIYSGGGEYHIAQEIL